jgi:signal transduction histidine kinase
MTSVAGRGAIPLHLAPTDLKALVESSLSLLGQQAKVADVALRIDVDEAIPAITLDSPKIAWAITTLVGNALRYVRRGFHVMPGGAITVRATYDAGTREVALVVQDDGPGMAADTLASLFDARAGRPPTGLALLMIRDVVAAHGGDIDVQSSTDGFNHGTTIRITLPAA